MSIEDEIQQQKKQERERLEEQARKRALEQELRANGFHYDYGDPPVLFAPSGGLKAVIDEAKPNMFFPDPMIVRVLSNGKAYCRTAKISYDHPENNERPDAYCLTLDIREINRRTYSYYKYYVYIFESGLIAAATINNSDSAYYSPWDRSAELLKEVRTPEDIAKFRNQLIKEIAARSVAMERAKEQEAIRQKQEAIRQEQERAEAEKQQKVGYCYIATAVYGSYDCPPVWVLRRFRDETLAHSVLGRAFVRAYYAISPALVRRFGAAAWFQKLWRGPLDRLVERLRREGVEDTPYRDR